MVLADISNGPRVLFDDDADAAWPTAAVGEASVPAKAVSSVSASSKPTAAMWDAIREAKENVSVR